MDQAQIIDTIYKAIIKKVESMDKKEDYRFPLNEDLFDDYIYYIEVNIDNYWGWYVVLELNIGKMDETPLECDIAAIILSIEDMLKKHFENLDN